MGFSMAPLKLRLFLLLAVVTVSNYVVVDAICDGTPWFCSEIAGLGSRDSCLYGVYGTAETGCTWDPEPGRSSCTGSANPCDFYVDEASCVNLLGCNWVESDETLRCDYNINNFNELLCWDRFFNPFYDDHNLYTIVFRHCSLNGDFTDCSSCNIYDVAGFTYFNDVDWENQEKCISCTICENSISFDCSNLSNDQCAIRTCDSTCAGTEVTSPPTNSSSTDTSPDDGDGGSVVPGQQVCIWTAWLEECPAGATLVALKSLDEFEEAMTELGNEGKNLVAADYGDGVWMGFFQFIPGTWRWRTTYSFPDFVDEATSAYYDGYRAESLVVGKDANGETVYLAWYRYDPSAASYFVGSEDDLSFANVLAEMLAAGMHMTAGFGTDDGYWFAWFEEKPGASRWSARSDITDLQDVLDEYHSDGYYVSAIVHADDSWVVWGEQLMYSSSGWATRGSLTEMWDWITSVWDGHCVTALTHGCGQL